MTWYDPRTWRENKQIKKPIYARSYQAAKASRLLADFLSPSSSADKEIRNSIRTLRDRARELCRNEPYAQRALQIFRTNVVGENGLHFQSKRGTYLDRTKSSANLISKETISSNHAGAIGAERESAMLRENILGLIYRISSSMD